MTNPWLDLPLADYEGHMAHPDVAQSPLLAEVFAQHLNIFRPQSVAVIGCAGGNGFERIDRAITRRVVGVDLNGRYLEQVRRRFQTDFERLDRIFERLDLVFEHLELIEGDIQTNAVEFDPVDLVYAALVFEYVDVDATLARLRRFLNPGGALVTLVQLPSTELSPVSPSPYRSLLALESVMNLVDPDHLQAIAGHHGLRQLSCSTRETGSGKRFQVQTFQA